MNAHRNHTLTARALTLAFALPLAAYAASDAPAAAPPFDLAAPGAGPAHAGMPHGMPPGPGFGGMDGVPPFLRGIDLSDEQRDRIFDISYALLPRLRAQHRIIEHARRDLAALGAAEKLDEAKAASLIDAETKAMAAIELMHVKADNAIRAVLTPEQRRRVDERAARMSHEPRDGVRG